jgi:hypothetical protein
MSFNEKVHFTRKNPCPLCNGYDDRRLGPARCHGYRMGDWVNCAQAHLAPGINQHEASSTYGHLWTNKTCKCGVVHNMSYIPPTGEKPQNQPKKERPKASSDQVKLPEQDPKLYRGTYVQHWDYPNEHGVFDTRVIRADLGDGKKDYSQWSLDAKGQWVNRAGPIGKLLYRLPEILALDKNVTIFFVEGEKAADECWKHGLKATTNIGGAGKWDDSYTDFLKTRKIIIIPDNDPEFDEEGRPHLRGQKHAARVASELTPYCEVKLVEPLPEVGYKGDIYDWFQLGRTVGELADFTKRFDWTRPVKHRFHETELGELPPVEWILKPFIQSKSINMLSGESGTGKSYLAINWAKEMAKTETVLYLAVEDPSQYPERIQAWNVYHKFEPKNSKLYLETLHVNLISKEKTEEIIQLNNDISPKLVVIDTWAAATAGSNEIDNGEIETILTNARRFTEAWDCAVLVVHHFNKIGTSERGGSALKAGIVQAMKAHVDQDSVRIEFDKTRNGKKPEDIYYRWESVQIKVKLSDGTYEFRTQQVPVESDFAVMDKSALTPQQVTILKWMGAEIRREQSHRAKDIEDETRISNRTCQFALNKLLKMKLVSQPKQRDPYKVTDEGLRQAGYLPNDLEMRGGEIA